MKNSIHLLITGRPGVGKTTLLKEIIRVLLKKKLRLDGFYTEEIRKNQKRVGFRIMNIQGQEEGILSHSGLTSRYRIGKYRVDVDKMDEIVEKIRRSIKSEKIDVVIIDEIGPMELYSENFKGFIINMLKRNAPVVIGTIKEKC
ncbi:AAA family ATPase, partial [candidate division WOR-3 bacterium]|nr:AAA family ATPase [candidate division WOR-3 bacterium]